MGVGIWHPASPTLIKIRDAIVVDPAKWKRAAHGEKFTGIYRLSGDSLKRPPASYEREHPLVEDLKRKDFIGVATIPERQITSDDLLGSFGGMCRTAGGFVRFLCDAVGAPF